LFSSSFFFPFTLGEDCEQCGGKGFIPVPVGPLKPLPRHCPDCNGTLFMIDDGGFVRYRCRVGHAWSPESLLDEQAIALEGALWMALRTLEEKAALSRRMATTGLRGKSATGTRFQGAAEEADAAGATIRRLIAQIGSARAPLAEASQEVQGGRIPPAVR